MEEQTSSIRSRLQNTYNSDRKKSERPTVADNADLKREGGLIKGWRIKKYHICVIIVRVNKVSFYKIFS